MLRKLCAAACVLPIVIACAPLALAQDHSLSPGQLSLVDQTCTQVMGLKRGEAYFARCRESLSQSIAATNEGRAMSAAYGSCRARELPGGTASFSTCMLDASNAGSAAAGPPLIAYKGTGDTEAGKRFYDMAPSVRFNRERYACAQLGLVPDSAPFAQCVESLDGAFLPDPN